MFKRISWAEAQIGAQASRLWVEDVHSAVSGNAVPTRAAPIFEGETRDFSPVLQKIVPPAGSPRPTVTFRQVSFLVPLVRTVALDAEFFSKAGDSAILVEYGPMKLDFHLRARVHALETQAQACKVDGIWSFAPCIRSTMVRVFYDLAFRLAAAPKTGLSSVILIPRSSPKTTSSTSW